MKEGDCRMDTDTMNVKAKHTDGTSSETRGKLLSQDAGLDHDGSFLSSELLDDASDTFSMMSGTGSQHKRSVNGKEISEGELEELKQIFGIFDQDNDGQIAVSELRTIIGSLGQSTTEAEIMDMVDSIGELEIFSKDESKKQIFLHINFSSTFIDGFMTNYRLVAIKKELF